MNDFNQRIPKSPNIVDIENAMELSYWAREFKISEQKLISIVKKVGSEKEKVKAEVNEINKEKSYRGPER